MSEINPEFAALTGIEETALVARLEAVRKTISHAGEKGRSLETELMNLIRSFLPAEYGLSTGFVASIGPNGLILSSQLDIIIYDALRAGPIARLGSCEILPLEATYACIEVKASLVSTSDQAKKYAENSIETCIQKSSALRAFKNRYYYAPEPNTTTKSKVIGMPSISLRTFIFAYEAAGDVAQDPSRFAERISQFSRTTGDAHLHGVYVGGSAYYASIASEANTPPENRYRIRFRNDHLLASFKWGLIHSLARFPRYPESWTPALNLYHQVPDNWKEFPTDSPMTNSSESSHDESFGPE